MPDEDPRDSWTKLFGGISMLLESDEVMEALKAIPVEPESSITMADILVSTATSFADFKAAVEQRYNEEDQ